MTQNFFIPPALRDLVFLDTETTGLDPDVHEMINLAAVRLRPDFSRELGTVDRLIHPQRLERAEMAALEVNRFDPLEWRQHGVHARVALVEFAQLMGAEEEVTVVGHNPHFDWDFIRAAYRREGLAMPRAKYLIDTASIAWPLAMRRMIDKLSLETLCAKYGVTNMGAHRAMADVRRTISVYKRLLGLEAA